MINKTDLAQAVGADLTLMGVQAKAMRGSGPLEFAQVKHGVGVQAIADHFLAVWRETKPGRAWMEQHGVAAGATTAAAATGAATGEKRKLEDEKEQKNGDANEGGEAKKQKGEGK